MISQNKLREVLLQIFFKGDEVYLPYLVPLVGNWWQPTSNPGNLATYIGYAITGVRPELRTAKIQNVLQMTASTTFRMASYGPQAEEIIRSTMFWDERDDVQKAFGDCDEQLNYISRHIYTMNIKQEGLNDNVCWVTDARCTGIYRKTEHQEPWFPVHKSQY